MADRRIKRVLFATQWWQHNLMRGVARHAAERGWHLNLQMVITGKLPTRWTGDGIITTLGENLKVLERFFGQTTCPSVSLSLNHPEIPMTRVGIDNDIVGCMAAGHFLDRAFRNFGFYSAIRSHVSHLRYQAYERYIKAHGYQVENLQPEIGESTRPGNWDARQKWLCARLEELPKPVAVFAHDDSSGVEVLEACLGASIRVPEDVAVLGMLDIDLFRESTLVPLSSIHVDFDAYTQTACDLLARLMAGEAAPSEPILFPPAGIAVRQSSDVIAAQTPEAAAAIAFMQAHYAEPIGVMDVARAVGMSHTRFYQLFKTDLGHPPNRVLNRIRLTHAKAMLAETRFKLEMVAESCGFVDRVNLHRNFKRHVGQSPAAYRKQVQAQSSTERIMGKGTI